MQHVFPDYYKDFKCINSKCRHNCCIGWEIDIDRNTADFYRTVSGKFGKRLSENISIDGEPHFILGEGERCPFLNGGNLCDIITTLGEEHLCTICAEHPRFHNELPGRIESGLGLCCEEAARLIISREEPMMLEISGESECEDEIIVLRDKVIAALQACSKSIPQRIEVMLSLCGAAMPEKSIGEWARFMLSLERLDDEWTKLLCQVIDKYPQADLNGFDQYMSSRQTEYEQLLVYIIYRHFANAINLADTAPRAAFAAFTYTLLYAIGAVIWTETEHFEPEQQIELARMFSSEIEYSDENLYILLDELSGSQL